VNTTLDDPLMTKEQVERFAAVMLGGRAADLELGIGAHAGASSDLESVNRLLRSAMLDLGLYGPLTTGPNNDTRNWPRPGITLTEAVSREIDRSLTRALEIVRRRRKDVAALAQLLIVERVVTGDGLAQLLGHDTPVADTRSDGASAPRRA
jgi:ATP-dependent Zn protease